MRVNPRFSYRKYKTLVKCCSRVKCSYYAVKTSRLDTEEQRQWRETLSRPPSDKNQDSQRATGEDPLSLYGLRSRCSHKQRVRYSSLSGTSVSSSPSMFYRAVNSLSHRTFTVNNVSSAQLKQSNKLEDEKRNCSKRASRQQHAFVLFSSLKHNSVKQN